MSVFFYTVSDSFNVGTEVKGFQKRRKEDLPFFCRRELVFLQSSQTPTVYSDVNLNGFERKEILSPRSGTDVPLELFMNSDSGWTLIPLNSHFPTSPAIINNSQVH